LDSPRAAETLFAPGVLGYFSGGKLQFVANPVRLDLTAT